VIGEVRLLERLGRTSHPLILSYKHCWIEEYQTAFAGPKIPCLFILMEYSELGNLDNYLRQHQNQLIEKSKWQIFLNVAVGLKYLHDRRILHRDLKLSNVLLFLEPRNRPLQIRFVLSDFGTSIEEDVHEFRERTGATGTLETMAPELLVEIDGQFLFRHSFASDVWSLGIILFKIFFGVDAFTDDDRASFQSVDALLDGLGLRENNVPSLVVSLLRRMLVRNPVERITVSELLEHSAIARMLNEFGLAEIQEREEPQGEAVAERVFSQGTVLAISFDSHDSKVWMDLKKMGRKYRMQILLLIAALAIDQPSPSARVAHVGVLLWLFVASAIAPKLAFALPLVAIVEFFVHKAVNVYQICLLFGLALLAISSPPMDEMDL
jgi:serine/threonine protein kinase